MIKHKLETNVSTWINVKNYFEKKTPTARGFHRYDTVNGSKHAVEYHGLFMNFCMYGKLIQRCRKMINTKFRRIVVEERVKEFSWGKKRVQLETTEASTVLMMFYFLSWMVSKADSF